MQGLYNCVGETEYNFPETVGALASRPNLVCGGVASPPKPKIARSCSSPFPYPLAYPPPLWPHLSTPKLPMPPTRLNFKAVPTPAQGEVPLWAGTPRDPGGGGGAHGPKCCLWGKHGCLKEEYVYFDPRCNRVSSSHPLSCFFWPFFSEKVNSAQSVLKPLGN